MDAALDFACWCVGLGFVVWLKSWVVRGEGWYGEGVMKGEAGGLVR